jgi:hypothetical protein
MKPSRLGGTVSLTTLATALFLASQSPMVIANSDTCCADAAKKSTVATVNRGYLNTPRSREEFPWLTRGGTIAESRRQSPKEALAALKGNRALASSPRFLEEHPELLRSEGTFALTRPTVVPAYVMQNSAFAASPRTREEFPALLRAPASVITPDTKLQIAPLK